MTKVDWIKLSPLIPGSLGYRCYTRKMDYYPTTNIELDSNCSNTLFWQDMIQQLEQVPNGGRVDMFQFLFSYSFAENQPSGLFAYKLAERLKKKEITCRIIYESGFCCGMNKDWSSCSPNPNNNDGETCCDKKGFKNGQCQSDYFKQAGAELLGMSSYMLGQFGSMPWIDEDGKYTKTKYVGAGILHQKTFTFSGNDNKTGVSYVGSANSSPGVVYEMGVFIGNDELYDQLTKIFDWWWLTGTYYLKNKKYLLRQPINILNRLKSPYDDNNDDSYKFNLYNYNHNTDDIYRKLYYGLNKDANSLWPTKFQGSKPINVKLTDFTVNTGQGLKSDCTLILSASPMTTCIPGVQWDLEAIINFINNSVKILWVNFFEYQLFEPFVGAILNAKNRGVYVRMVLNPRLYKKQTDIRDFAIRYNIDYKWFGGFKNEKTYTDNHMKWMVSDKGFYVGGNNILPGYFTATGGICLTILTTGPLRKNAQNWFEMWWTGSHSSGNPIKTNNPLGQINSEYLDQPEWVNENNDLCNFTNNYYNEYIHNKPSYCILNENEPSIKETCKGEIRENCKYPNGKYCGVECKYPESCAAANPDCCFDMRDKINRVGFCYTARDNKCKTLKCPENTTCNEKTEACECNECFVTKDDGSCEQKCLNNSKCIKGKCKCDDCFRGDRCEKNICNSNQICKNGKCTDKKTLSKKHLIIIIFLIVMIILLPLLIKFLKK